MKKSLSQEEREAAFLHRLQLSESFSVVALITLSGGLQDAYSYFVRGQVFANAQTGNIVLMSQKLFHGEWPAAVRYLLPLLAFALGILAAEQIQSRFPHYLHFNCQQLILLLEAIFLFGVAFLPESVNVFANSLVSFTCAMQVQAFRRFNGYNFASTMCIGNMRSGMESLSIYLRTGNRSLLKKAGHYFFVIFLFAIGAGTGSLLIRLFGTLTIWFSSLLLFLSFLLLSVQRLENQEEEALEEEIQGQLPH